MITIEQIDEWAKVPAETPNLEFKEAKNNFDSKKLVRYCVAIANEGGGHLVLGMADNPPRTIVGTSAFADLQRVAGNIFDRLRFRVEVQEISHPDGRVLVFRIPSRPRGNAYEYEGAYLMRVGESLVGMSSDQLRQIFAEGAPDWLNGTEKSNVSKADIVRLLDTQTYFDLLDRPYPTTQTQVVERILEGRLIEKQHNSYSISRLGALLLAKSLNDFPDMKLKAPRVVVYEGKTKLSTRSDMTGDKGYAVGFQGLVDYIENLLPQNEVVKNALRHSMKLVPAEIIRELAANALIHQDFDVHGASVMVEIYEDRVEFSNPGLPIVEVERFIDGYQSRNEKLADLMRRMGICEVKGSGIDRVVHAAEELQLPAPVFRSESNRTSVTVFGAKSFEDMNRDERVRACFQHCVLKYVASETMTNSSLRTRFKLSAAKASSMSQLIAATIDDGLIKADSTMGSSRKYARYLPYWA